MFLYLFIHFEFQWQLTKTTMPAFHLTKGILHSQYILLCASACWRNKAMSDVVVILPFPMALIKDIELQVPWEPTISVALCVPLIFDAICHLGATQHPGYLSPWPPPPTSHGPWFCLCCQQLHQYQQHNPALLPLSAWYWFQSAFRSDPLYIYCNNTDVSAHCQLVLIPVYL